MAPRASAPPSLAEVKRLAVVDHILAAARHLVLSTGLDVTMDQLAEACGVSRRTLFRHFATREKLLAAAFEAGMTGYRDQLPPFDGDVDGWLRDTCLTAHRMNSTIGPGFFELASRTDLAPELRAVEKGRRREFRAAMSVIAETLWTACGNAGPAPAELFKTVSAHLSPFFTAALAIDTSQSWRVAGEISYHAISSALPSIGPSSASAAAPTPNFRSTVG